MIVLQRLLRCGHADRELEKHSVDEGQKARPDFAWAKERSHGLAGAFLAAFEQHQTHDDDGQPDHNVDDDTAKVDEEVDGLVVEPGKVL